MNLVDLDPADQTPLGCMQQDTASRKGVMQCQCVTWSIGGQAGGTRRDRRCRRTALSMIQGRPVARGASVSRGFAVVRQRGRAALIEIAGAKMTRSLPKGGAPQASPEFSLGFTTLLWLPYPL